jgi:hypothetical protein
MKRLMNFLFLSCIKASELIEKKLDKRLTSREKIQLFVHTKMCDACNAYQKQSKQLDHALNKHFTSDHIDLQKDPPHLSEQFKKDLLEKIKNEQD